MRFTVRVLSVVVLTLIAPSITAVARHRVPRPTGAAITTIRHVLPARVQRVMVVGDSISVGFGGSDPWRCRFWRASHRPVQMVGPFTGLNGTGGYPAACDPDHNAIWGRLLSEASVTIAADTARYRPDLVIVLLGVNDVDHAHPLSQIISDWQRLVRNVRSAQPRARIMIGTVLPTNGVVSQVGIDAVNGWLVTNAAGLRVILARTAEVIDPVTDLLDGVHPGPTGAAKLADVFLTASGLD